MARSDSPDSTPLNASDLRRRMVYVPPSAQSAAAPVTPEPPIFSTPPSEPPAPERAAPSPAGHPPPAHLSGDTPMDEHDELTALRERNRELEDALEELRPLLEEAVEVENSYRQAQSELQELRRTLSSGGAGGGGGADAARTAALEREAEELRSTNATLAEQNADLRQSLSEIEQALVNGQPVSASAHAEIPNFPSAPRGQDDLEQMSNELERERCKLIQERRQLENERRAFKEEVDQDERELRAQEVQMARERADVARKEMELRRLNAEIQHQLELLQRGDNSMADKLRQFQRRQQEVNHSRPLPPPTAVTPPNGAGGRMAVPVPPPAGPAAPPAPAPGAVPPKGRDSGLLRKFFGQGGTKS